MLDQLKKCQPVCSKSQDVLEIHKDVQAQVILELKDPCHMILRNPGD